MSQIQALSQTPPDHPTNVARTVNMLMEGKINSVGTVTLTNAGTTTTLIDNHINPVCVILFWPQTANAAGVTSSLWYDLTSIPTQGNTKQGQITLNHSSAAHADLTFGYVIFT